MLNHKKIIPTNLQGEIIIPPSKSISHRAIICGGLSKGLSRIENIVFSDDIIATLDGMKAFGVEAKAIESSIKGEGRTVLIEGNEKLYLANNTIDCKESGSTLRFLIPMATLIEKDITFMGRGKLVERPLEPYYNIFKKQGIAYKNNGGKLPLTVTGKLEPGIFKVKGNISSQFITGLMFVLPLLNEESKIIITNNLESKGYVDLTMDTLKKFNIEIENINYKEFIIKGNQKYIGNKYRVEGDFSQAAFWLVAGILGTKIRCLDLNIDSLQGDRKILDILQKMGGQVLIHNNYVETRESETKGIVIDGSQCPDLVPILAVLGAVSKGTTKIINASRLRIKESDRLKAISTELNKLGADIKELNDGLIINGKDALKGGKVDSWNDHRIAMALGVASIKCKERVIISNSEAVVKSYPEFWNDFIKLGGKLDE